MLASDWYIPIQMCSSKDGSSKVCCGNDYTCCGGSGVFDLAVFTAISKPPGLARATSSRTGSSAGSTAATASPVGTQTAADDTADTSESCRSREISIGLGVGLGVPLVLALVAVGLVVFRSHKLRETKPQHGSESFATQPCYVRMGDQQLLQQSVVSELHGRGRDPSARSAQELSDGSR